MSDNVGNRSLWKNPGENVGDAAVVSTFKTSVFENLVAKISATQSNSCTVFLECT